MQFSTLALATLLSLASAQKTTVVTVAMNGTLTYSPSNIKVNAGEFVQFQFAAGNHTVTQSTFDAPCQPISLHSNTTGFHSGFQPASASASSGMIPTYTIQINNTNPIWVYCSQATHCEKGMVMVINENTTANSTRSLTNYKTGASKATTIIPGAASSGTNSTTTTGSGSSSGSGSTTSSGSATASTAATAFGTTLAAPGAFSLLGLAATLLFL